MKKKSLLLVLVVVALAGFTGCAGSQKVSSYGFTQPEQSVSIPHPVEMEKAGDQYVTVFTVILDAGVWGVEGVDGTGAWPILAERKGIKPYVGCAFTATDLNWWGDFPLQVVIVGREKDLLESNIVSLNRDGGWVYDLTGREFDYDPEKFDKDPTYQAEVFKNGTTLSELQGFWKMYAEKRGVNPEEAGIQSFREIRVGSAEWEEFKIQLAESLGHNYKMSNGEIRQGYMPLKEFRYQAAQNNGTTSGQRFARSAFIPVAIDPISAGIGVTSSILNGLVAASNGPLTGFYARAECLRGDLKPNFRLMQEMFKQLLRERDMEIFQLKQEIQAQ